MEECGFAGHRHPTMPSKISIIRIAGRSGCAFAIDNDKYMISNTAYFLTFNKQNDINLLLLLDFLNSPLSLYQLDQICTKFDETGWRWLRQFIEQIRIPSNINECQNGFNLTPEENEYIYSKYLKFFI